MSAEVAPNLSAPVGSHKSLRAAGLLFGLLLIGVIAGTAIHTLDSLRNARQWVDHSQQVLYELEHLVSDLEQADSDLYGYLLTNNTSFLAGYNGKEEELVRAGTRIRNLTTDSQVQQGNVDKLEPMLAQRISGFKEDLQLNVSDGLSAAEEQQLLRGKLLSDRVHAAVHVMAEEENRLYRERNASAARQEQITTQIIIVGAILSSAVIGLVFWFFTREVTRRRQAEKGLKSLNAELEERVRQRTEEVRRNEQFLAATVENMQDAIFVHRQDKIVFLNRSCMHLFGAESRKQVIGKGSFDFFHVENQAAIEERIKRMLMTGEAAPSREEKVIRLDGKEIEVEVTAAPFEDRGERAIVVILRDITAKRSTEQQLRQAQKMEAVGQLTGGIAHDFNNLLGVIIGNLELALDMPEDTRRVDAHLQIAIDSALRGAELTHRLLAFARKQPLHPRAFVVNNVLPDTIAILQRTIGAAISIRTSLGDGLWEAFADLSPLQDAVINLAINARDAMPKGGTLTLETANVHLDEQYARNHPEVRPGEYVMLAVTDTGTGMPPEIVERVLEPFFTTKEVGKGTGLGLSMVYGFAKQSGGHLKIYSEVGFGTSVKLYLPRALESATTPSPGVAVQHPLPRGSETILIAEDNPDLRKMAVEQLLSLGYRVFEADNGESALAILRGSETLDLLFTEIVMTGQMTGYELVQEAKKLRPDLHILHTTGYAGSAATNGNAGERHFLNKPYRKLDLAVKLRHVLEQAPSRD